MHVLYMTSANKTVSSAVTDKKLTLSIMATKAQTWYLESFFGSLKMKSITCTIHQVADIL